MMTCAVDSWARSALVLSGLMAAAVGSAVETQAGLIGLYQFNDAANLGLDTSGNGNHGLVGGVGGGPDYVAAGYQGGAAMFGASSTDFILAPIDVRPQVAPQMTWGAWVKPGVNSPLAGILSIDNGGFDRLLGLDTRDGTAATSPQSWAAFTGTGVLSSGIEPSQTEWTFLAGVYDQSLSTMTLYVNDQSFTSATDFDPYSQGQLAIGGNTGVAQYFTGQIDNVFVYDAALDPLAIADLRANGFPTSTSAVPAPGSALLFGQCVALFAAYRVRRRRREATEAAG